MMEEEMQGSSFGLAGSNSGNGMLIRQLAEAIEENLSNHLPSNAVFLAERLIAEHDSEETRGILAECYMAENKHYKVLEILKHSRSEMNRYKFALVCVKLSKFEEGERALLHDQEVPMQSKQKNISSLDAVPPNGCYGYYLLGLIQEGKQKFAEAKEYFIKALELNPTLWTAYEKICKIGDQEVTPYKVFCETRYKQYQTSKRTKQPQPSIIATTFSKHFKDSKLFSDDGEEPQVNQKLPRFISNTLTREQVLQRTPGQPSKAPQMTTPVTMAGLSAGLIAGSTQRNESNSRNSSAKRRKSSKPENILPSQVPSSLASSQIAQPASQQSQMSSQQSQGVAGPSSIPVSSGGLLGVGSQQFPASSYSTIAGGAAAFEIQHLMNSKLASQHAQAFSNPASSQFLSAQTASALLSQDYFGQKAQLNFGVSHHQQQMQHQQQQQQQQHPNYAGGSALEGGNAHSSSGIRDICTLLRRFGEAFYHMSLYMCREAIEQFKSLPSNHYKTGWVLTHIGRCFMEIVKYSEAEKYYEEALRIEPYRLEGIEYYSSCLWHLKKQVELCFLAHKALERSLYAPETWIAVGNCFSLQKEHESALKFFQRAIQLNQFSAYAHSLCGHEFVYNEDFNRARKSFQHALNFDSRNYNALWGLGNIFYKQEKYNRASEQFQKAININSKNPVLFSFMGMSLAADRKFSKALEYFECSERLDPKNGLNKFQKANTLVKLDNYDAALKELEELYRMMPREAPIPMLMGKVYKKLKKTDMALKYFTEALDLENKDSQRIKALIESLHHDNHDFVEDLDI